MATTMVRYEANIADKTELWDDKLLTDENADEDHKFSDVLPDDFLLMDDGLEIEDDFSGLLDISPASAFDSTEEEDQQDFDEGSKDDPVEQCSTPEKRSSSDDLRADSPPPKKLRFDRNLSSPASTSSVVSVSSVASVSSIPSLSSESGGDRKYKLALQHLALSMKRSEMTRNAIIRARKEAETKAKLAQAQMKTVNNAENFLHGNSKTLTSGLEQSRRMLQSFMSGAKTLPF